MLPLKDFTSELGKICNHEIDKEKKELWINSHENIEKEAAQFVAENIKHISMEMFLEKINMLVTELFLLSKEKKLLLYIPTEMNKSNYFVSSLIYYECNKRKITFEKVSNNLTDFFEYDLPDFLIVTCDDALFTGKQLAIYLSNMKYFQSVFLYLAIGFISETAKQKILREFPRVLLPICAYFFDTLKNIARKAKKKDITKYVPSKHSLYFDFKLPDEVSVIYEILAFGAVMGKKNKIGSLLSNNVPVVVYK